MGKKTPKAPDYKAAAEAQAASDKEMLEMQTKANRMNQYNPWGSLEYTQDDDGNWTQTQTLNDQTQGALDSQLEMQKRKSDLAGGMMGRMENEFGESMDWSQFGEQQGLEFDPTEMRQKAEDAAFSRATSRLDPRFEQEQQALEVKLANQGLSAGDASYDSAMKNFTQSKNDAYENAQNQAVGQGRAESSQLWGQQKGAADYANQLRQNQINEATGQRQFSLNEMNAIMSGQQVNAPQFNSYNQAGRGQATDYTGAAMNQSNFDQAAAQGAWSGLGSLASIAGMGMMCDRRVKRHINRIGKYLGYPLYAYQYIWGEWAVGVMSDEVNPEAVQKHPSGFDWVDYSKIIPCEG